MKLRKADPREAESLTRLAVRSKRAWGYSDDFMEKVMPDMVVHRVFLETEYGIVAEDGGVDVGYAIVRVDGEEAFLRDLFIEPTHFGRRIGSALFHEAARFARSAGAKRMTLYGDPHAIGFYERLGMQKVGDEPSIAGGGRTLPIMAIDLE